MSLLFRLALLNNTSALLNILEIAIYGFCNLVFFYNDFEVAVSF